MRAEDIVAPVQSELAALDRLLASVSEVDQAPLGRMLGHVLGSRGKRLRPALVFLVAKLCDADTEPFLPLAAAVEALHTATLVHDDMIDNAHTRRGRTTLNVLVGNRASVLAGDYLFARAAAFAAQAGNLQVMTTFANVLMEICDGELRQLFGTGCRLISRSEYFRRIEQKTAALFSATTEMAAVLSGAEDSRVRALRKYGYHLGLAFQMADDILDFVGGEQELGKPVGNDLRQGTITLPVICLSETMADSPVLERLAAGEASDGDLAAIVQMVRANGCIERARAEAEEQVDLALQLLSIFPASQARWSLEQMARFSLHRTS